MNRGELCEVVNFWEEVLRYGLNLFCIFSRWIGFYLGRGDMEDEKYYWGGGY